MGQSLLSPRTIVDYIREPFVYVPGNVRVTLDREIRTGLGNLDFLNPDSLTVPAGEDTVILEVKWDTFLPDVIRDLVHVGFTVDCLESGDGHAEKLDQKNATLAVTFHLGIDANTNVLVMSYLHGQWIPVDKVVNHGDGTVSCELEDVGPVVFVVCDQAVEPLPGEQGVRNWMWWLLLLLICIAVLTRMLLKRLKRSRK
jgi:hypothetical protein